MSEHHPLIDPVLLGQLVENMKRGTEDRRDIKDALIKLNDGQESLRRELSGLQQTANSTATALHGMISERHAERIKALESVMFDGDHETHGERLAWVEGKIKTWDSWIGTGKAALAKLIGLLIGSAVLQGFIIKWISEHLL